VLDLAVHYVLVVLGYERDYEVEQHHQQNDLSEKPEQVHSINYDVIKDRRIFLFLNQAIDAGLADISNTVLECLQEITPE